MAAAEILGFAGGADEPADREAVLAVTAAIHATGDDLDGALAAAVRCVSGGKSWGQRSIPGRTPRSSARSRAADARGATPPLRPPADSAARERHVASVRAALIASVPEALRRHRALGIAPAVTADTLADVGRKLALYGADVDIPWLIGLLRGDVLAFGRLQYERAETGDGRAMHIPEDGPLDPARVDSSLAQARSEFGAGVLTCTSWLLDPRLRELSSGSNIAAFAARFDVSPPESAAEPAEVADAAVVKFVFRRPLPEVLDPRLVVPRTSLERLVATHLRNGQHWTEPRGILRIP